MSTKSISRRSFLKASGVVLAVPTIVPSSVFGKNAPSNRINIAGIGLGTRGGGLIMETFVKEQNDVRVVAVCDCFVGRRENLAAEINKHYGAKVCDPVADFRKVLERKDVDGVVIATPDHWHVPLAYYAAQARKDMYVEKPLGVAMAWAWKLRKAVKKNKVIFQYGTQQRSSDEFTRAVELVRNGYIGKIKSVDAWCAGMRTPGGYDETFNEHYRNTEHVAVPEDLDYEMWTGPAPMKPYTKSRCTEWGSYWIYDNALGFIAGWGAHPLDIAQWGLDMDHTSPVKYQGNGAMPPQGLFDTIDSWDIHCEYANGIPLHFMSTTVAEGVVKQMGRLRPFADHGTTFFGENGWISVNRGALYASTPELQRAKIKEGEKPVYRSASQSRNFVECIKSRKPTINPLESAIRSDTISHISDICIRLGRPIQWDPEKERIIGDKEASKMLDRPMRKPWKM